MKISTQAIAGSISQLRVRSHDGCLYTVDVFYHGLWYVLVDGQNRVLSFRSIESMRVALKFLQVERCTLLHASSYHEMIGLPEQAVEPMEIPIRWASI